MGETDLFCKTATLEVCCADFDFEPLMILIVVAGFSSYQTALVSGTPPV